MSSREVYCDFLVRCAYRERPAWHGPQDSATDRAPRRPGHSRPGGWGTHQSWSGAWSLGPAGLQAVLGSAIGAELSGPQGRERGACGRAAPGPARPEHRPAATSIACDAVQERHSWSMGASSSPASEVTAEPRNCSVRLKIEPESTRFRPAAFAIAASRSQISC